MTDHPPSGTEREILSQPQVWQQVLDAIDPRPLSELLHRQVGGSDITDIVVTGCGSTHYLALTVAALLRDAGQRAIALPASELLEQAGPRLVKPATTLLLAISRSGTTTETVRAVDHFRAIGGGHVAAITCYPDSTLAQQADISWAAVAAQEEQVAQTRSFTSMVLIASTLVGALRGDDVSVVSQLPALAAASLADTREPMAALARDASIEAFYFLGCWPALRHCLGGHAQGEGDVADGVRGVPHAGVPPRPDVDVRPDSRSHRTAITSAAVSGAGSTRRHRTVWRSPGRRSHLERTSLPTCRVGHRRLCTCCPLQLLALERALAKGLDPDNPRHLTAVIHLDATAAS